MAIKKLLKKYKKRLKMEYEVLNDAINNSSPNIIEIKSINECIGIYQDIIRDLKNL